MAKRMMFAGVEIASVEAAEMGVGLKSVPDDQRDAEVETQAARMEPVPINQLAMKKMVINTAVEEKVDQTQRLASLFDGITRHSPEWHELQTPRKAIRLETGSAGPGHRDLRLDPQQTLRLTI